MPAPAQPPPRQLNVAVCGAGSFGRNHLRVYRDLAPGPERMEDSATPVRLAAIIEDDSGMAAALEAEWRVPVFRSLEECLAARRAGSLELDALSICVPTSAHADIALPALDAGLDLLIEKPLAATLPEADAIVRQAAACGQVVQVGHLERFNPAVTAVLPRLNRPMFFEAHRLSIFTPRALDVDVVLDLMIHDLDVVLTFAASPVRELRAVGLPILSSRVDIANVRVEFESGAVANFTASRVSTERVRKLRFFQPHQYVSIDYARQELLLINVDSGVASGRAVAAGNLPVLPSGAPSGLGGLAFDKPAIPTAEPLRLEILAFLAAVRSRATPVVTAEQGRNALALALEINREIAAHAARAGL